MVNLPVKNGKFPQPTSYRSFAVVRFLPPDAESESESEAEAEAEAVGNLVGVYRNRL